MSTKANNTKDSTNSTNSFANKKVLVTGGAGFVGSHIVDRLVSLGANVIVYDNFSTGRIEFLKNAQSPEHKNRITIVKDDLLNLDGLTKAMTDVYFVFHLAANADVKNNVNEPTKCLYQNTIATNNVLEAMRINNVKKMIFSSTGSVYGESTVIPTPEVTPITHQTSLYGASKLACEGLIQAYCESFGMQAIIFRFVSLLGERYTHGHIFDFYKKLLKDPTNLEVLGDGTQKKSYLLVNDCMDAIFLAIAHMHNSEKTIDKKVETYNLGTPEYCEIKDSIKWITQALNVNPTLQFTGGNRGWIGDNPFIFLDTNKIAKLGWKPKKTIQQAVIETVEYIKNNEWILKRDK